MLMSTVIGLATMAVCLVLQSELIVVALRYCVRHPVMDDEPTAREMFECSGPWASLMLWRWPSERYRLLGRWRLSMAR